MCLQEEYVYRLLIQSVVNPLGAPDARPGFRPKELAQHLRQVRSLIRIHFIAGATALHHRHESSMLNGTQVAGGNWGLATKWNCYNVSTPGADTGRICGRKGGGVKGRVLGVGGGGLWLPIPFSGDVLLS